MQNYSTPKAASHQIRPMSPNLFKMLDDELMKPGTKWSEVYRKVMKMRNKKKKAKKAMLVAKKQIVKPKKSQRSSDMASVLAANFKKSLRTPRPSPNKLDRSQHEVDAAKKKMEEMIAEVEKSMTHDIFGNPKQ